MPNHFVDIHVIQTLPSNNLNRDETGSPKTMTYGGVRRARVSSQAWKAAMRKWFNKNLDLNKMGVRTKNVPQLIIDEINSRGRDDLTEEDVINRMTDAMAILLPKSSGKDKKSGINQVTDEVTGDVSYQTEALFMIGRKQISNLVDVMLNDDLDEKERKDLIQRALQEDQAMDASLFGRMVADLPAINVDAAAQVAHAMGVSRVIPEFDFYTAMDDFNMTDHAGSAMMGTIEFNSSVLYRYADISLDQLKENLGNDEAVATAVEDFVKAFVYSMPSGKQNTFAAQSLPDAVVVTIRPERPVSYADAFVEPVEGKNLTNTAIDKMVDYAKSLKSAYDLKEDGSFVMYVNDGNLKELGSSMNLNELVSNVGNTVRDVLHNDEN